MNKATREFYKGIEASNKKFEKMTPAKKRVQIGLDIIAQLAAGQFKAQQGVYVESSFKIKNKDLNKQLSDILPKIPKCTVCGIGSAFICAVLRADNLTVDDAGAKGYRSSLNIDGSTAYYYLEKFFSRKQLNMIENAFEQNDYSLGGGFASNVEDDNERLRLIWENVAANNGTFVPSKRPEVKYITTGFMA